MAVTRRQAPSLSPGPHAAKLRIGKWKPNIGKSAPAGRPPRSQIFTLLAGNEHVVSTGEVVSADGVKYRVGNGEFPVKAK